MEETSQILTQANAQVSRCLREANHVADNLAKVATCLDNGIIYHDFLLLPVNAKGSFHLDKWQLPFLRMRYDKANFKVS